MRSCFLCIRIAIDYEKALRRLGHESGDIYSSYSAIYVVEIIQSLAVTPCSNLILLSFDGLHLSGS